MKRPGVLEGVYVSGDRTLEYWTRCPACSERKDCGHDCGHEGRIVLKVGDVPSQSWSGIITQSQVGQAVKDYIEVKILQMRLL